MQTATAMEALQLKTGREALFGDEQVGAIQEDVNLNAHRYFVQMGWDILRVDTLAIPNAYLIRGEITPCRTFKQKANLVEIREADLIAGTEERDSDGRTAYGYYRKYAFYEAERLLEIEKTSSRQDALIEIRALHSDLGGEVYRKVNLNALFFPDWPNIPDKHDDALILLTTRLESLKGRTPENIPAHYLPVIFAVGDELIEAIVRAKHVQEHRLTYTHSCMKLTPKDEAFKREYDLVDYEMLKRTGQPQIHSAEIQTAQALEKLTDHTMAQQSDPALLAIVEEMREGRNQQDAIIQMLLAERQGNGSETAAGQKKRRSSFTDAE